MKLWIARDSNGELWAYDHKPIKKDGIFQSDFELDKCVALELPERVLPEVTWENSPVAAELKFPSTDADRGRRESIIRGLKQLEKDYMLSYEEEIDWLNKLIEDV